MENKINHKKLLEKIIQSNDIIRFALICDQFGAVKEKLPREGLSLLLNEYETDKLVKAGVDSWYYRKLRHLGRYLRTQYGHCEYGCISHE